MTAGLVILNIWAQAHPRREWTHVALATMGLGLLESRESEGGQSVAQHLSTWIAESPVVRDEQRASHLAPDEAVLHCATCHAERDAHRGMFGSDCGACHGTRGWVIPEYRHPSSASTDCAQCHRARMVKKLKLTLTRNIFQDFKVWVF